MQIWCSSSGLAYDSISNQVPVTPKLLVSWSHGLLNVFIIKYGQSVYKILCGPSSSTSPSNLLSSPSCILFWQTHCICLQTFACIFSSTQPLSLRSTNFWFWKIYVPMHSLGLSLTSISFAKHLLMPQVWVRHPSWVIWQHLLPSLPHWTGNYMVACLTNLQPYDLCLSSQDTQPDCKDVLHQWRLVNGIELNQESTSI